MKHIIQIIESKLSLFAQAEFIPVCDDSIELASLSVHPIVDGVIQEAEEEINQELELVFVQEIIRLAFGK